MLIPVRHRPPRTVAAAKDLIGFHSVADALESGRQAPAFRVNKPYVSSRYRPYLACRLMVSPPYLGQSLMPVGDQSKARNYSKA